MTDVICPDCRQKQWSVTDCNYVILFGTCWSCDKKRWKNKELSLKKFEDKEKEANHFKTKGRLINN